MTISHRAYLTEFLFEQMKQRSDIWVLLGDVGYGYWDQIRATFPDRCLNCGAAEQSMVGMAVGLALSGKIPFVYTITPFLLYRPFETLRNYVNHEQIPVKLLGTGRDDDYSNNGFSHHSYEDKQVLDVLNHIKSYWPDTKEEIIQLIIQAIADPSPYYINIRR